ncbi:hypothetical protein [Streptomyces microflavus]|uniref:hypothetical protein n=1 Tax=Streptomyces microflavus TaxID=1919 RepID=UPI003421B9F5
MVRVKMMTLYAGPDRSVPAGQTAQFDKAEAEALVSGGYGVYADTPAATRKTAKEPAKEPAEKPIEKWNVAELQKYAADQEIDLGQATVKADILKAVVDEIERRRDANDD